MKKIRLLILHDICHSPNYPNPLQIDQNNNGIGDACEDFPKIGINTTNPQKELHLSNSSLYIDNVEKAIILKNQTGQCFLLWMNGNNLITTAVPCP